jgi:hypothetical protein
MVPNPPEPHFVAIIVAIPVLPWVIYTVSKRRVALWTLFVLIAVESLYLALLVGR